MYTDASDQSASQSEQLWTTDVSDPEEKSLHASKWKDLFSWPSD